MTTELPRPTPRMRTSMRRSSARDDSPAGHRHFDRDRLPLPRRALVAVGRGDDERHRVAPGSQPSDKARMPRTMSASTSAPKTTITQSIGGWAGGVPISRLARASCEMRRNNSLTGSGDPPPFAMPQIIAPTPTVRNSLRWLGRRQHGAERAQWSDVATGGGRQAEGLQTARGLGPLLPRHAALSRATSPLAFRSASGLADRLEGALRLPGRFLGGIRAGLTCASE